MCRYGYSGAMKKIILVDDDNALRSFLKKALEKEGLCVTDFDCGEAAFDYMSAVEKLDLLLTDIVMPGMDGFELSKRTKEIHPSAKIMYMSGFSAMENESDGAGDFISKPFHLGDIVKKVQAELLN